MKTCSKCKQELPLEAFNKRGNGVQPYCRECNKIRSRQYYKDNYESHRQTMRDKNQKIRDRNKTFVDEQKSGPCLDCKKKYPPYVMDFDHLGDKFDNVATMVREGYSIEKLIEEIAKCELVCSNCHRIRTHNRLASLV